MHIDAKSEIEKCTGRNENKNRKTHTENTRGKEKIEDAAISSCSLLF